MAKTNKITRKNKNIKEKTSKWRYPQNNYFKQQQLNNVMS